MTEAELLNQYGLPPEPALLDSLRAILRCETEQARRDPCCGNVDLVKLCCVQLFSQGDESDILPIWECKMLSQDFGFAVDVQLLCGPGLEATKHYLGTSNAPTAGAALAYLIQCEAAGDFADFTPAAWLEEYLQYYKGLSDEC